MVDKYGIMMLKLQFFKTIIETCHTNHTVDCQSNKNFTLLFLQMKHGRVISLSDIENIHVARLQRAMVDEDKIMCVDSFVFVIVSCIVSPLHVVHDCLRSVCCLKEGLSGRVYIKHKNTNKYLINKFRF